MSEEELYKLAISNVHRYSLLNEIFAIRDNRFKDEENEYTINVNGYISLDVLNRYVRNINELVEYQNIDTINNLKNAKQEKQDLISYLEERIEEEKIVLNGNYSNGSIIMARGIKGSLEKILDKVRGNNDRQ